MKHRFSYMFFCLLLAVILFNVAGCGNSNSSTEPIQSQIQTSSVLTESSLWIDDRTQIVEQIGETDRYVVFQDGPRLLYGIYDFSIKDYILEPTYWSIGSFSDDGIAIASLNNAYGFIDTDGNIVIDFYFSDLEPFKNGFAIAKTNSAYGLINRTGEFVIPASCYSLNWINDSLLSFQEEHNGLQGIYKIDGTIISEPRYDSVTVKNNYIWGKVQHGYIPYTTDGTVLCGEGSKYPHGSYVLSNQGPVYLMACYGDSPVNQYGYSYSIRSYPNDWALYLNSDFEILFPYPCADAVAFNSHGYAVCSQDISNIEVPRWGVIDLNGNYVADLPELHLGAASNSYIESNGYFAIAYGTTGGEPSTTALVALDTQEITIYDSILFVDGTDYTIVQDPETELYGLYDKRELVRECLYDSIESSGKTIILTRGSATEKYPE